MRSIRLFLLFQLAFQVALNGGGAPGYAAERSPAPELSLELTFDPRALGLVERGAGIEITLPEHQPVADAAGNLLPARPLTVTIPAGYALGQISAIPLETREVPLLRAPTSDGGAGPGSHAVPAGEEDVAFASGGLVTSVARGTMAGVGVVSFVCHPVLYDAGRAVVILHTRMAVSVSLVAAPANSAAAPLRQSSVARGYRQSILDQLDASAGDASMHRADEGELLGDPGYFQPGQFPSLDGSLVEYIIITSDALEPEMVRLADWKTRSGVPAAIRTISWIEANYPGRDRAERIRNFIRDAYRHWGTLWVLLAGDESIVPSRLAHTVTYGGMDIAADLYYGDLDGLWDGDGDGIFGEGHATGTPGDSVDLYPDVFVGRAPIETPAEASVFVDKTLTYLRSPLLGYQNDALFVAEVVFPIDWEPPGPFTMNGCDLAHDSGEFITADWDTTYVCEYPHDNESRASVVAAMNAGPALVSIIGHGDPFKWSTSDGQFFSVDDARSLSNFRKYFVMFYANCNTNSVETESINELLLLNPAGGSIASVAATRFDFPSIGRYYQDEFYRLFYRTGVREVGALASLMKVPRVSLSRQDNSYDRWTQLTYILLGDPQLATWRTVPRAQTLVFPPTMALGDSLLTVEVETTIGEMPVADALVTLWKPDSGEYARGITGSNGQVTFPIRPGSTGTLLVTSTHGEYLPKMDSLAVVAGVSRLHVSSVTVNDDSLGASLGNGDGVFDAGERVEIEVTLENESGADADSVMATLALPGATDIRASLDLNGVPAPRVLFLGARGDRPATLPVTLAGSSDSLVAWGKRHYAARAREDTTGVTPDPSGRAYLWQDASGWHIRVAGAGFTHLFTGSIAVDGSMLATSQIDLESGDSWSVEEDSLYFSLAVDSTDFEDGIDFVADDSLGVTLIAGTADYGFVPMGTGVTREFVVESAATSADRRPLRFLLDCTRAGGDAWSRGFRVDVAAPALSVEHRVVDDALPGGDGDGIAEVGETVGITLHAQNRGTGLARGVTATFRALSGATVTDSVVTFGDIPAGAIAVATAPVGATLDTSLVATEVTFATAPGETTTVASEMGSATTPLPPGPLKGEGGATWTELGWIPTTAPDVRGYIVYRAPLIGGSFTRVNAELGRGAYYRDEGLVPESGYRYRYAAVDSAGNVSLPSAPDTVFTGPPFQAGFPVQAGNRMFSSTLVVDLDVNGDLEVVTATHGWKLPAWEHTGAVRSGFPVSLGQESFSSPAAGNLDGDAAREIVVGANDRKMYAFNPNGTGLLGPSGVVGTAGNWFQGSPTLADLDLDGDLEILAPSKDQWLYVWRKEGTGYLNPDGKFGNFASPSISCPAVADVDGDGFLEIFVGTNGSAVYAWNHDGTGFRQASGLFKYIGGGTLWGSPVIGDIDADGTKEIICASMNGNAYAYTTTAVLKAGWPRPTGNSIQSSPALGDLDRDGKLEVVVGSNDKKLYAWRFNGNNMPGYPVTLPDSVLGSPAIGDITGDGFPDVVVGCGDHRVYAFDRNGKLVPGWPQRTYDEIWHHAPVITDLDHDGDVEVLQGSYDGYLYAWDCSAPYNPSTMDWPMFQHDRTHSGFFGWVDPDAATGVEPSPGEMVFPRVSFLRDIVPNPATTAPEIAFDLAQGGRVRVSVFDVEGRLVERLVDDERGAGRYRVTWTGGLRGGEASSGVYFIRLEAEGRSWSKKLVMIR